MWAAQRRAACVRRRRWGAILAYQGGRTWPASWTEACSDVRTQEGVVTLYNDEMGRQNALSAHRVEWLLSKRQEVPAERPALGAKGRIMVDFGQQSRLSAAPWNNIFSARYGAAEDVRDHRGHRTAAYVRILEPFMGELPLGPPDVDGLPEAASEDMVLTGGPADQMPLAAAKVVVGGLDPSLSYTLTLFVGRLSEDPNISLRGLYTVNQTETRVFDSRQNQDTFLTFGGLKPSKQGMIVLEVQAEAEASELGQVQGIVRRSERPRAVRGIGAWAQSAPCEALSCRPSVSSGCETCHGDVGGWQAGPSCLCRKENELS